MPKTVSQKTLGAPLLGALLRMPVDVIRERMLSALHDEGFADLTPGHMLVIRYPGPNGLRPVELAAQIGMTKQALNYLLRQLEEGGYLERVEDPEDQRSKLVSVTDRGWRAVEVMRSAVEEVEREFAEAHGEEALESLRALLVDMNRTLGNDLA